MKVIKQYINKFFICIIAAVLICTFVSCKNSDTVETDTKTETDTETSVSESKGVTYEAVYDEEGNQNGQKVISSDGTLKSEEKWDRLNRVTDISLYNADGTKDAEEHMTFSEDGDTPTSYITVKYHYTEGTSSLENYNKSYYNEKKQLTDSLSYNADGSLINMCKYGYDDVGNTISEEYYGSNYGLEHSKEYVYNDNDMLVEEIGKDSSGNIVSLTKYEYNDDGNIEKQLECDADGSARSYCLYVYGVEGAAPEEQIYVRTDDGEYVRYN